MAKAKTIDVPVRPVVDVGQECVYAVLTFSRGHAGQVFQFVSDAGRADTLARSMHGVAVALPVTADYRV